MVATQLVSLQLQLYAHPDEVLVGLLDLAWQSSATCDCLGAAACRLLMSVACVMQTVHQQRRCPHIVQVVPPWVLFLLAGSKRLHSIYLLQLFSDGAAMCAAYIALAVLATGVRLPYWTLQPVCLASSTSLQFACIWCRLSCQRTSVLFTLWYVQAYRKTGNCVFRHRTCRHLQHPSCTFQE